MSEASQERASDRGPRGDEGTCSHVGCPRDHDLSLRRLIGSEFVGAYCPAHDPLNDPAVSKEFEAIDGKEHPG